MKGTIVLSRKEAHRGHVLEQVDLQALTLKEAAQIMGISYRQAKRIHKRWKDAGYSGDSGHSFRRIPDTCSGSFRTDFRGPRGVTISNFL